MKSTTRLIEIIETLIPGYASQPEDSGAGGNVAVCIIDENGCVSGKIWGKERARGRQFFRLASQKAVQVWVTGMKTGEYEKRLFNGEFEEEAYGISKPELIGWEGGQPLEFQDGTRWAVGFSGFRGINDLAIVESAFARLNGGDEI